MTLHDTLLTIDTHIDIPWPNGGPPGGATPGAGAGEAPARCVDLPKMRAGGLKAGVFAAYVPQGRLADDGVAFARATAMLRTIGAMADEGGRVCPTADAIEAAARDGVLAVVPAVENAYPAGEDLGRFDAFRAAGAVYVTLTHNGHNAVADAAIPRADLGDGPERHGGLSAFGRAAIERMNRLGLLVDVSHASRATMLQAAELSRSPVLATHSCARALCDHPRNLDDAQLDVLRDVGGVIQVTAVPGFVRKGARSAAEVSLADFVAHIDHVVRRVGVDHVGIGSDFDGGGGVTAWRGAADCAAVTAALEAAGYDARAIGLIWGGNFLRVLRAAEAVAAG